MAQIIPVPLSTLFKGDVTIEAGLDVSDYGYGDLNVKRQVVVYGTQGSVSPSIGALVLSHGGIGIDSSLMAVSSVNGGALTVAGGIAVGKNAFIGTDVDVDGHTTLDQLTIDTADGPTTISGAFGLNVHVGSDSFIGVTDGSLFLSSTNGSVFVYSGAGNNEAIVLKCDEPGGGMQILTKSGGLTVNANNNGGISLNAEGKASNFTVNSTNPNQNLSFELKNESKSSLHILSETSGLRDNDESVIIKDALLLETTAPQGHIRAMTNGGSIYMNNDPIGDGHVEINTGKGGFQLSTPPSGYISIVADDASSQLSLNSRHDGQKLGINVFGNTMSSLHLYSEGNGKDAIHVESTNGSILMDASETICIGTNVPRPPVILGSLDVQSSVVSVNTTNDASGSDGGIAVKRYQSVSDTNNGGDVVDNGTPVFTGIVGDSGDSNSANSATTIELSGVNVDVADFWIKVQQNGGTPQVRKIKTFDIQSQIATIYSSSDQIINPSVPVIGKDFSIVPDSSFQYSLYKCNYIHSYWDESTSRWSFSCSAKTDRVAPSPVDVQVDQVFASNINTNTINGLSLSEFLAGDSVKTTVLHDDAANTASTDGVIPINDGNKNYGLFIVFVRPVDDTLHRPSGVFVIGRSNDPSVASGSIVRLLSVRGEKQSRLNIVWSNGLPRVVYHPYPATSGSTVYSIKLLTV